MTDIHMKLTRSRTVLCASVLMMFLSLSATAQQSCDSARSCTTLWSNGSETTEECRYRQYSAGSGCDCWYVQCYTATTRTVNGQVVISIGPCHTGPSTAGPFCRNGDDVDCSTDIDGANSTIAGLNGTTELAVVSSECGSNSPIIVDVEGDGYALTSARGGVAFDLNSDGFPERLSWTAAGSDEAFLAADRNGNGIIDTGRELFGNFTPQPWVADPNGFLALAVYDRAGDGGNNDGLIDATDSIFPFLRLWTDANHNGVSEPHELRTLAEVGLRALHLDYKESRSTDDYGNAFRFRGKVDRHGSPVARWAWDVYLVRE
ncbi:MAG TPA: hypothetical protein VF846_06745 [Thermoanaerobaculia bacterium]